MKKIIFSFILTLSFSGFSQQIETLDRNNVRLVATADGNLFEDLQGGALGYEIPKGIGFSDIYTMSFWFAAMDDSNQLRTAAQNFAQGPSDFFPGPYSSNGSYTSPNYANEYLPALWKISREDIDDHIDEYMNFGTVTNPHPSLLEWPAQGDPLLGTAQNLAPFVDVDLNGIYDPYAGDYPNIKGCEALYIIMNDSKETTGGSGTESLDIEIHIMLYQYASQDFLNDVTFIDTRVINRGNNDLSDFRSASYLDVDMGYPNDDYMGTDPVRNVIYGYNGTDFDSLYGSAPPALGVMLLNKPMDFSRYFTRGGSPSMSDPYSAPHFWNYLNGFWRDGTPVFFGGSGYWGTGTSILSKFVFTRYHDPLHVATNGVDPGFEWSETGAGNPTGDRRMFMAMEEGNLLAGQEFELHQAIVYGRDLGETNIGNVDVMLAVADSVQQFYNTGTDECNDPSAGIQETTNNLIELYPNPTHSLITLVMPFMDESLMIEVLDVYGRTVYSSEIHALEFTISLENECAGTYFVRVIGNELNNVSKVIKN